MNRWDERMLNLAKHIATWSKDPSTKVGAVIVRPDNSIVSTGYNGFPRKLSDDSELYANREIKYSRTVHGEINAMLVAGERLEGYTLYTVPFMPCAPCALLVIQAGITRVVCPKPTVEQEARWTFDRARALFSEAGVSLEEV